MEQNNFKNMFRDLSKKAVSIGEVYSQDAINASLENIILTNKGDRIFNPNFGSILTTVPFEILDFQNSIELLDILLRDIRRWEKRIIIIEDEIKMNIISQENKMYLLIPYIIKQNGKSGAFSKEFLF